MCINKSQIPQFKILHKKGVFLLGKNIEKNSKANKNLNINFDINSIKYMIWIASKRGLGISNEMLFKSLKKTKVISDYFGLKLIIRAHPTNSRNDIALERFISSFFDFPFTRLIFMSILQI